MKKSYDLANLHFNVDVNENNIKNTNNNNINSDIVNESKINTTINITEEREISIEFSDNSVVSVPYSLLIKHPYSKLASYFNGQILTPKISKTKNNVSTNIFLDRSSQGFLLLLQFLKTNHPPLFISDYEKKIFFDELKFWEIHVKIDEGELLKFDMTMCPNFFSVDKNHRTLTKNTITHGIVLLKRKMSIINPFIEFSVILNNPFCSNRKILLALVEGEKFKRKYSSSSFEKGIPYVFYWDIFYNKLMKQFGDNYKTMELNKNCQCYFNFYENKFGLKYDQKEQTVELYRNDVNLGVVIKNIPPYLTPALEISMDDCKIKLSKNNMPQEKFFL